MKTRIFQKLMILSLLLPLTLFCKKEEPVKLDPFASLATNMECKFGAGLKGDEPGPNQSCVKWNYDGDSTLILKHFNAGFNCCPEEILIDFSIDGDVITITEDHQSQLCRCNCLYDLEITLHHIEAGKYTVQFVEPFVIEPKTPLVFTIDLEQVDNGKVCSNRDYYPWGE